MLSDHPFRQFVLPAFHCYLLQEPTDQAIRQLQRFIIKQRADIQETTDPPLTFHGLRHTYAAETYQRLIDTGTSSLDAHLTVSRLLGHERPDVTDIYLASLPKEGHHGK